MVLRRHCLHCDILIPSGGLCDSCQKAAAPFVPWKRTAKRIVERDRVCMLRWDANCTRIAEEADHIVPRSLGGTDDDENLQGACRNCNRAKYANLKLPPTQHRPDRPLGRADVLKQWGQTAVATEPKRKIPPVSDGQIGMG